MTLADVLNAPTEFELDGETFRIRQPDQLEQGQYQRWLEQLALDVVLRQQYRRDEDRAESIRMHNQDCAAGAYEWGSKVAVARLLTPKGFAKLLAIICRDQGLTESKAEKLVEKESHKLAAVVASKVTQDPLVLAAVLAHLGLPSDYLSRNSATGPSAPPPTSPQSAA